MSVSAQSNVTLYGIIDIGYLYTNPASGPSTERTGGRHPVAVALRHSRRRTADARHQRRLHAGRRHQRRHRHVAAVQPPVRTAGVGFAVRTHGRDPPRPAVRTRLRVLPVRHVAVRHHVPRCRHGQRVLVGVGAPDPRQRRDAAHRRLRRTVGRRRLLVQCERHRAGRNGEQHVGVDGGARYRTRDAYFTVSYENFNCPDTATGTTFNACNARGAGTASRTGRSPAPTRSRRSASTACGRSRRTSSTSLPSRRPRRPTPTSSESR